MCSGNWSGWGRCGGGIDWNKYINPVMDTCVADCTLYLECTCIISFFPLCNIITTSFVCIINSTFFVACIDSDMTLILLSLSISPLCNDIYIG